MKLKKRGKGGTRDKADPRYTNIHTAAMQLGLFFYMLCTHVSATLKPWHTASLLFFL